MFSIRKLNIRNKLITIIMLATTMAVCLAGSIFIVSSIYKHRKNLSQELTSLAGVIGNNCKVILEFNLPEDAQKVLATLEANSSIIFACIYNPDGTVLSTYGRHTVENIVQPPEAQEDSHVFKNGFLHVFHYVRLNENVIGTIYLQDDMRNIEKHLMWDVIVLILTVIIALIADYIISSRLQKLVSEPILTLADIAENVSEKKDYSVRAQKQSEDEVGKLIDSFNDMLSRIQVHEQERDNATEALQESEERLQSIIDNSTAVIYLKDTKSQYLLINRQFETLFHISKEEIIGKPDSEMFPKEMADILRENDQKILEANRPLEFEENVPHDDGLHTYISIKFPLHEASGTIYGVCGISTDITERKRAEEALRESESELNACYENAPLVMLLVDREWRVHKMNSAAVSMARRSAEESLGLRGGEALRCIHTVDDTKGCGFGTACDSCGVRDTVIKTFQTWNAFHRVEAQIPYDHPDGPVFMHVLVSTKPLKLSGKDRVLVCLEDITARKQTEEAIQQKEAFYKLILDSMVGGVWVADRDNVIYYCNKGMEKISGLTQEQISIPLEDFPENTLKFFRPKYNKAKEGLKPEYYDSVPVTTPIGRQSYQSGWLIPIVKDSKLDGMICTVEDVTGRKQTEEALINRERFLDSIIEQSPFATWISDAEGTLQRANPALQKMLNLTESQLVGVYNVLKDPLVEQQGLMPLVRSVFNEGKAIYFTARWCGEDIPFWDFKGSATVDIEATMFPILDATNKLTNVVLHWIDVTDRKRAEAALRASEERFKAAFESANDCILIWDRDYNYLYANQAAIDHVGTTRDKVIGKNIRDGLGHVPDFMKLWISRIDHVFETEKTEKYTDTTEMQGKFYYTHSLVSPVMDELGEPIAVCVVYRDITDLKQAEQELREGEELLKEAQELAHVGSYSRNIKTNDIKWSDETYRIFGYAPGEVSPTFDFVLDHIHPEDKRQFIQKNETFVTGNEPYENEYRIIRVNGVERFVHSTASLDFDEKGFPIRMFGAIQDITDRKQAEEEKAELESQLRQAYKMEAVGTLAGGIAHDFNNILGIIIGNSELSLDEIPEWSPAHENIKEIQRACLRARDVVRQLLSYARKEDQKQKPLLIASIVNETSKFLRASIPSNIEIRHHIEIESETIMGDPTQINQVLLNLCSNAADAMSEKGGILDIRLEVEEVGENFSSSYPGLNYGQFVKLSVSDTGGGIPEDAKTKIFDPYFTTKEAGKGTGMGLAVVHGIVENHKGMIAVHSDPGKGATFEILLPIIEEKENTTQPTKEIRGDNEKILFVDDEQSMVRIAQKGLENLGYQVIASTDPAEALELFKANKDNLNLVITDMTMPNMTGDRLAEELIKIRSDIPIILCTGYSERIEKRKIEDIGIRAVLMKPLIVGEISRVIRCVLDEKKQTIPTEAKRILVIDNEEQMRSLVRHMLESAGYEIMEAPNGNIAIWLLMEKPADLVVTNLIMPEKEGIETIAELKQDFPDVKIIAISGGSQGDKGRYLEMAKVIGVDRVLAKPYEKKELLKVVEDLLG